MSEFQQQDLFGGAIKGPIPSGWIDASDLREVPDHQEIFLSRTTLSNLIFEINERVTQEDIQKAAIAGAAGSSGTEHVNVSASATTASAAVPINSASGSSSGGIDDEDQAAALYHLRDLCDPGDSIDIIKQPSPVDVHKLSSSPSPPAASYAGVVLFKTPNAKWRSGPGSSSQLVEYTCYFLLVRLRQQATDLMVLVNIPHEEFEKRGDTEGLSREETMASRLLDEYIRTLEVKDWDLFV